MLKSKNTLLHKAIAFVLTFSLLASLVSFNFTASAVDDFYTEGGDSAGSPVHITTFDELNIFVQKFNNAGYSNLYAVLDNDITITGSWTPIKTFTGKFDGNNHKITFNGTIDTTNDYNGLYGFCSINEGTITNLTVEGSFTVTEEQDFVGGIAGLNRGTISNCTNNMEINARGKNTYAGGIAGVMDYGTITNCKNSGNISVTTATTSENVTDKESSAGGIVALNYNGKVEKCTNTGAISNADNGYTGGIVGCNNGTIDNCLNTTVDNAIGSVTNTNSYVGGIAGLLFTNPATGTTASLTNSLNTINGGNILGANGMGNDGTGTVENCYYVGSDDSIDGTTVIDTTNNELYNGTITYKLNNGNVSDPAWGQIIASESSNYELPVIGIIYDDSGTATNIVYKDTDGTDDTYTNGKPNCGDHQYENGVCSVCGDVLIKVAGYSLTIDGTIGLNYYINMKKEITSGLSLTFNVNDTDTNIITAEKVNKDTDEDPVFDTYKATVILNSDQMNCDIIAKATVNGHSFESTPYKVNDYLVTINSNASTIDPSNAETLKDVAVKMYTYGYYANEYFNENAAYTPTIALDDTKISSSVISNDFNLSYKTLNNAALTHYASSLQHLEKINAVFYVSGVTSANNVYMKYETVSLNNKVSNNDAQYIAVSKNGAYYYATTDKIPIAKLSTTKFAVTFGTGTGNDFVPMSNTKYYGPYTYIKNILTKYEDSDPDNVSYKFTTALYLFSESAKRYFTGT